MGNLRAAWEWALAQPRTDLLEQLLDGMATWSELVGLHHDWSATLAASVERLGASGDPACRSLLVRMLTAQAESLLWQGDLERAFFAVRAARAAASRLESPWQDARISLCEGRLLRFRGGADAAAHGALRRARALAATTGQRRVEARSLLALSSAAADREEFAEADAYALHAEHAYRELGDRHAPAQTAHHRGRLCTVLGDYAAATLHIEQSLHVARAFGNRGIEGLAYTYLGIISDYGRGRHRDADEHFGRARTIARMTADPYLEGIINRAEARNALHAGDLPRAERRLTEAVERARDVGNTRALNDAILGLAQLALAAADPESAAERARQAAAMAHELHHQHTRSVALFTLGRARERLGQPVACPTTRANCSSISRRSNRTCRRPGRRRPT
jgi:tetratricopeptide (TPR) repeat protein